MVTRHPAFYTLSLHDALPIWIMLHEGFMRSSDAGSDLPRGGCGSRDMPRRTGDTRPHIHNSADAASRGARTPRHPRRTSTRTGRDRKSTRLNSSHVSISYAVF